MTTTIDNATLTAYVRFVRKGFEYWRAPALALATPAITWVAYLVAFVALPVNGEVNIGTTMVYQYVELIPELLFWAAIASSFVGCIASSLLSLHVTVIATVLVIPMSIFVSALASAICGLVAVTALIINTVTFVVRG